MIIGAGKLGPQLAVYGYQPFLLAVARWRAGAIRQFRVAIVAAESRVIPLHRMPGAVLVLFDLHILEHYEVLVGQSPQLSFVIDCRLILAVNRRTLIVRIAGQRGIIPQVTDGDEARQATRDLLL